jgi:hypothetical protein
MDPISPISPITQNYYSHLVSNDQPLPPKLAEQLKDVSAALEQIQKETQYAHPNRLNLTRDFEHFDQASAAFLTEVSHNPNRGYEKQIKDQYESMHSTFLEDLSEIKQGEEALRDVLYDSKQLQTFLETANHDNLAALGNSAQDFATNLNATFKLQ